MGELMDRDAGITKLIADLEQCLNHADALDLSLAAVFILHAIEKIRIESDKAGPANDAAAKSHIMDRS